MKPVIITAAQIEHTFARHNLALHRYAKSPALCDRRACSGLDVWGGGVVYLAAAAKTDFVVVVFRTPKDAAAVLPGDRLVADRRGNALLLYLRSAKTRLAIVRRIFRA